MESGRTENGRTETGAEKEAAALDKQSLIAYN